MIEIRHELPEDAVTIAEVNASATACLRQTYRPNSKALANKSRLSCELKRLVAIFNGRMVGTTQYYQDNDRLRLLGLGVLPDYRKHGVARALIGALMERAPRQGARGLTAFTIRETGNVPIFERLGFQVVSEGPDDYSESDVFPELTLVELAMDLQGSEVPDKCRKSGGP